MKFAIDDKKMDVELYTYLLQHSKGSEEEGAVVYKSDLPIQVDICQKLGIKSRNTLRAHMSYLIEEGYIKDMGDRYILAQNDSLFLKIDLDTIRFLNDTAKEEVQKVYLYLVDKWNWKEKEYEFDLDALKLYTGKKGKEAYRELEHILEFLENNGLIVVKGKDRMRKLLKANLSYKRVQF